MNDLKSNILLLGFPQTGKSTFIGTLYYVLNNPDEISSEALELTVLDGDEKYIIDLKDSWLKFKSVGRTNFSEDYQMIRLNILNPSNRKSISLEIPDLSGEIFQRMFEDREKTEYLASILKEAIGYLLFINCSNYTRATSISQASDHIDDNINVMSEQDENLTNWEHKYVPTQVKVIEILQFILLIKKNKTIRLNLIFSAWDMIRGVFDSPQLFLESEFPMLNQYLNSNKNKIELKIFGVSAQGCNYDSDIEPKDLAKNFQSSMSRIQVITDGGESNDLTLTLRNLIE